MSSLLLQRVGEPLLPLALVQHLAQLHSHAEIDKNLDNWNLKEILPPHADVTTIKDPKNLKSPSFTWREFKHKQLLCSFSPETLLKPTSGTLLDNQRINRTLARVIASGTCLSLRDSPSMIIGCYLPCHGLFGFIKDTTARRQDKQMVHLKKALQG